MFLDGPQDLLVFMSLIKFTSISLQVCALAAVFTDVRRPLSSTRVPPPAATCRTVDWVCLFVARPPSRYTPAARLAEVIYDSTLVTFTYDEASGTVKTIHLTHNGFISSIRYRQTGKDRAAREISAS